MALLYSWATKEYLFKHMTLSQILLYHEKGMKMKYGTADKPKNISRIPAKQLTHDQLVSEAKKLRELYGVHGEKA